MVPMLKATGTKRLKIKHDTKCLQVSMNLAFNLNLRLYTMVERAVDRQAAAEDSKVGGAG